MERAAQGLELRIVGGTWVGGAAGAATRLEQCLGWVTASPGTEHGVGSRVFSGGFGVLTKTEELLPRAADNWKQCHQGGRCPGRCLSNALHLCSDSMSKTTCTSAQSLPLTTAL